jgi:hypothetical protein
MQLNFPQNNVKMHKQTWIEIFPNHHRPMLVMTIAARLVFLGAVYINRLPSIGVGEKVFEPRNEI